VDRRDPGAIPVKALDLSGYEAVVLDNVQATSLSLDQQLTLQSYVRDMGRGLLVVGGQNSYSMGAYADTDLENLLPVRATPPDRHDQGDLALLLVIDTSGSMSLASNHVVKMEMAKQAAVQAVAELKPTDTVGVLVFNTRYQWVVPPQIVADNGGLPDIQARISTIKAAGGTDIYSALDAAYQSMSQLDVRFRHVLLLTDGESSNPKYQALVGRNQALGVTLSTVAIGQDADTTLLSQLAQLGAGRSYATQRFDDIPSIVAKETAIASRASVAEGQFQPLPLEASPLLSGLEGASLPNLAGYVQTTARPGATIALASPRQDPILAHWHYGLGRVVAWTSDAGSLWARDWFAAPAAAVFAQALRWTMTAPVDPRLNVSAQISGSAMTLSVDSLEPDGSFGDGFDTRATVVTPAASATEIRLPQVAPGRYQRTFDIAEAGVYQVLVRQVQPSGDVLEEVLGTVADGNVEERSVGTNEALLGALAAQTGGRKLVAPEDAFAPDPTSAARAWQPLWAWLVVAALLLFPVDVAMRRLQVSAPRWKIARWWRRPGFVRGRGAR
jgi:Ca-activated chloride channel homolog